MNKLTLNDVFRGMIGFICGAKSFRTYRETHPDANAGELVAEFFFALAVAILVTAVLDLCCRYRRRYPKV